MIDVWSVVANGIWVLGLSILLAALSWAVWAATAAEVKFRIVMMRTPIRLTVDASLLLFCAGLTATARTWWERVLWSALAIAWGVQIWLVRREKTAVESEETA